MWFEPITVGAVEKGEATAYIPTTQHETSAQFKDYELRKTETADCGHFWDNF